MFQTSSLINLSILSMLTGKNNISFAFVVPKRSVQDTNNTTAKTTTLENKTFSQKKSQSMKTIKLKRFENRNKRCP